MDIIKNIMDISANKRETLFVFLTDKLKYKYRYYELKYLENQMRLAKNNEYSARICCLQPL